MHLTRILKPGRIMRRKLLIHTTYYVQGKELSKRMKLRRVMAKSGFCTEVGAPWDSPPPEFHEIN